MSAQPSASMPVAPAGPAATAPPSSTAVLVRTLRGSFLVAGGIAFLASIAGFAAAGWLGVVSALIGAIVAVVFLGMTAASILVANRFTITAFFAIVLGAWLIKFALFLVLAVVLRDQAWISAPVLFLTLIGGVVGSLVVDLVVVARMRMPTVSDIELPGNTVSVSPGARNDRSSA